MVGKLDIKSLDAPETIPSYRVTATVETRGQKHQKSKEERKDEDEYSASGSNKEWQKFYTEASDRQAVKLRRQDIAKLFFQQVVLQKGLVIIETDIQLINGQILKKSHLFSTVIDIYWKLKKLGVGEEIPVDQLITEQYVEVSIVSKGGTVKVQKTRAPVVKDVRVAKAGELPTTWSLWPLFDKETKVVNWAAIIIYGVIIVCLAIAFVLIW